MKDESELKPLLCCPFCGGDAELVICRNRTGYGEYERTETYHAVKCKKCGSTGKQYHEKALIDFTKYTVLDFRSNPILRAKVEDDYEAYQQQTKELAVAAWQRRAT